MQTVAQHSLKHRRDPEAMEAALKGLSSERSIERRTSTSKFSKKRIALVLILVAIGIPLVVVVFPRQTFALSLSVLQSASDGKYDVHSIESPCARTSYHESNEKKCAEYEKLEHIVPDCSGQAEKVPRIYHSVGRLESQTFVQNMVAKANPSYKRNHLDDRAAGLFIRRLCGEEAATAYACLAAPAYRADLFRFCAMYAQGGVYLDEDILPLFPLHELYSPCSSATVGYDMMQSMFWSDDDATIQRVMAAEPRKSWAVRENLHGKQMKIIAAAPGAPLFKCALETTIAHIRHRFCSESSLALSGPVMLHKCYANHSEGVAVTYSDSRHALWPYSGMRRGNKVLAVEIGNPKRHFPWTTNAYDADNYADLHRDQRTIRPTCALRPTGWTDVDLESQAAICTAWHAYYD